MSYNFADRSNTEDVATKLDALGKIKPKRDIVLNSWRRSIAYGIDPLGLQHYTTPPDELQTILKKNAMIISYALPEMEKLLQNSFGDDKVVLLTDANGVLLKVAYSNESVFFKNSTWFIKGADWSEQKSGTNAIALSLAEKKACYLRSFEHFIDDNVDWTCFANPIFDQRGNIIADLGLVYANVADIEEVGSMTLVVNASREIENALSQKKSTVKNDISESIKKLSSIMFDGLIATDEFNNVIFANDAACSLLKIKPTEIINSRLDLVIPGSNTAFWAAYTSTQKNINKALTIKTAYSIRINMMASFMPLKEIDDLSLDKESKNLKNNGKIIVFNAEKQTPRSARSASLTAKTSFNDLIGESPVFVRAVEKAKLIAQTEANILLLGESGVGKDLFAQCIHNFGKRQSAPYCAINCAAIPQDLLASELFGYEEGAFTGAKKGGNAGKLECSNGGTLLLDEIGEMSFNLQAYLLRAIETKEIQRIGSLNMISINPRIISATNINIHEAIREHKFRADLFYRLSTTIIEIPPLRERKSDIPLLAEYFIHKIANELGIDIPSTTKGFMDELMSYDYPGNIRELKNIVDGSVIISMKGELTKDILPLNIFRNNIDNENENNISKSDAEREIIAKYLAKFHYNKTKTADVLGISRSTLYRKMTMYGL